MAQPQEQVLTYADEDDYLFAQRKSVETVQIGRATLETAVAQEEQLNHAEQVADETEYALDKASRMIRNMTWSGWVANKFSKGPEAPSSSHQRFRFIPETYDHLPDHCRAAGQAVQNYHANIKVLEACETKDQVDTCRTICTAMYETANNQIKLLETEAYRLELQRHLAILRERQEQATGKVSTAPKPPPSQAATDSKAALFSKPPPIKQTADVERQDAHLDFMAGNLAELNNIATSLSTTIAHQRHTLEKLDSKSENITEKTRQVTRRADRIIQRKAWTPTKATFDRYVTIRHLPTGQFLSVQLQHLVLVPYVKNDTAVFALYTRQGKTFGLKNKDSNKWIGQGMLGGLSCTAGSFGQRQEWEADDVESDTKLLCASVGWGAGGYLSVMRARDELHGLFLSGAGVEERKKADSWCITEV